MSNLTGVTKFFATANEGFATALNSSILASATTVPLQSVSGLTDGSVFVGMIEPGSTNQQVFTGTVSVSGVEITGVIWTRGSNVPHAGGVTIVDYVTGTAFNMLSAGVLKQHSQTGAHVAVTNTGGMTNTGGLTTDTLTASGNATVGGTFGVTGAATLASLVLNGALTGTGLAGQVTSQSNAGTAGGTMYRINLSGIKLLWMVSGNVTSGPGGPASSVTLPTSFFSTIQAVLPAVESMATYGNQTCAVDTSSTTTISIKSASASGTASQTFALLVIGT